MHHRSRTLTASLTAAVAAGALLAGCSDDANDAAADPANDPSTGTTSDPGSAMPLPEARSDGAIPPLDAGRYRVPLDDGLTYDIDLTEGALLSTEDPYLDLGDDILKIELAGERFGVAADPCRQQVELRAVKRTVTDVLAAIDGQAAYDVRDLGPVSFGGATGRQIKISIPAGYDASDCVDEQVGLPGNPGTINNMPPGYTGDWWILEVAGRLVVAHHYCDTCEDGAPADIDAIVRGITFTPTS